ncbi:MAG: F420-0--gamma-glutamyl ligase [Clostridia bacterium]|nr:F420-0--gamma-glutamyl ligase [Clostridia bacterium]
MNVTNTKKEARIVRGVCYQRIPIKTPVVFAGDSLTELMETYVKPHVQKDDIVFLSEKMVACSQGRAVPLDEIEPSWLALLLSRFVTKSKHGIGLSMPETMEMALRECGRLRILWAAVCGAVGKFLHKKGWFYLVAGYRAQSIDGPCPNTIAPYNRYVVLGPEAPDKVARTLSQTLCAVPVLVVDINDLGGNILGKSHSWLDETMLLEILKDNPLGQDSQSTPVGIIRKRR